MLKYHKETTQQIFDVTVMSLAEKGYVQPLYLMILDGKLIHLSTENDMPIDEYKHLVNQTALKAKPEAIIFICEQWQVTRKKDDPEIERLMNGLLKPSEQDDKELYLTLIYKDKYDNTDSLVGKIESDPIGVKFVRESKWIDYSVCNMIDPW